MSPLTDDPNDPRLGRGAGGSGMNAAYLVLSEEERAKGFVRPVRTGYIHVGRAICGDTSTRPEKDPEDGKVWVCCREPGHDGGCGGHWEQATPQDATRAHVGGCGTVTWMAQALAETYARQPDFYGATYCAGCKTHLRVGPSGEFLWVDDRGAELPIKVGE